jgi:predicted outer membrane repeat protein
MAHVGLFPIGMGVFALALTGCRAELNADGLGFDAEAKATRTVCVGTGDYSSITAAIASAGDGDTIEVCAGTYYEDLVIADLNLTLVSVDGAHMTTIDGSGSGPVIDISGGSTQVTVEGFTITGGYSTTKGAGIHCEKSDVVITDNVIIANAGYRGAGLYTKRCDLAVTGNRFQLNSAIDRGGAAYLYRGDGTFQDNDIIDNSAYRGGGMYSSKANGVVMSGNYWYDNSATQYGGALYASGEPDISGDTFDDNRSSGNGGAVYLYKPTGGTFDQNVFTDNYAPGDGGALYARWMGIDITNNVFSGNYSDDDGGAARLHRATATFSGNIVTNNYGRDDGGGVKSCHGYTNFEDNWFEGNQAGDQGGGQEVDNEGGSISGSTWINNIAKHGGGLHMWDNLNAQVVSDSVATGNTVTKWGGGIEIEDNPYSVKLEHVTVTNNTALDGGGVSCTRYAILDMENVLIANNYASDDAGGVFVRKQSSGSWSNVVIANNYGFDSIVDVSDSPDMEVVNLILAHNTGGDAVKFRNDMPAVWAYNNLWDNDEDYGWSFGNQTGINGNIEADPDFTNPSASDYTLGSASASIDAGDPSISDTDGTRSDQGMHGGPLGDW